MTTYEAQRAIRKLSQTWPGGREATWPKTHDEIRDERHRLPIPPKGRITIAALWPKHDNNLGTLIRTCDALNAALVVPASSDATKAVTRGNTIGMHNSPVIFTPYHPMEYLHAQAMANTVRGTRVRIIGVEVAHNATLLADLQPATALAPAIIVLGHEANGIPREAFKFFTEVVEIPMNGVGNSLNVAVAGSLVAYKLAGLT